MLDHRIECARAEDFLSSLPDASVSLIVTDPPYHRVKSEAWDNQWKSDEAFLDWVRGLCREWRRVLRPDGSVYVFASPRMAWGVEGVVRDLFEVLSSITWAKPDPSNTINKGAGQGGRVCKDSLRSWFPIQERVTFAEQRGSDAVAMGEAGYESACEQAKRGVFGDYMRAEFARAGVTSRDVAALFPSRTGGLTGCVSNWLLGLNCPTAEQYASIRTRLGGDYLRAEYETLRAEYETLRAEYDTLRVDFEARRRPFTVSAAVPYTDVWTYPTVAHYPGKHPCEKPSAMALDIVRASSRPGDIVLDCFAGSGPFPSAAAALGRVAWACDMDPHWVDVTRERVKRSEELGTVVDLRRSALVKPAPKPKPNQTTLFDSY